MEQSLYTAIQDIRKERLAAVYLLYGSEEGFVVKWLAKEIQKILLPQNNGDEVSITKYSFSDNNWELCVATAYQGDLFSSLQLVICDGFDLVMTGVKTKSSDKDLTHSFGALFSDIPPSPIILLAIGEKLDERKKLTKQLLAERHATVIATDRHSPDEWQRIIREWSGDQLVLTPWQMEQMAERCAGSLSMLRQEIDKLTVFAAPIKQVSDSDFLQLTVDRGTADLFEVVKAFVNRDTKKAYELYRKMDAHDSFFALLALLARQYRLIANIHHDLNTPDVVIARELGVHPYGVKVARVQSRRVSLNDAQEMLVWMNSLEAGIKSGRLQEKTAIEWFFLKSLGS